MTMHKVLDAFVAGRPRTKGSLDAQQRRGGRGGTRMVENVQGSVTWRIMMATVFKQAWRTPDGVPRAPLAGIGIRVSAVFYIPCAQPSSLYAARSGDVDKLTRNLLDALAVDETGKGKGAGVIANDAQVVSIIIEKRPASDTFPQGVHVSVWTDYAPLPEPVANVEPFAWTCRRCGGTVLEGVCGGCGSDGS